MVATAHSPQNTITGTSTPTTAGPTAPLPARDSEQSLLADVTRRIRSSPYLTLDSKNLLEQKLKGEDSASQSRAGLGGAVDPQKMAKMLDELEALGKQQPPLKPEHVQAIFLAGFVKGGVQGVMDFLSKPSNETYLKADGFEAMKGLLERDYRRSIRFIAEYTQYLKNDIRPLLDRIYGEQNVLDRWLKKIQEEDAPALLDRELDEESLKRLAELGYAAPLDRTRHANGLSKDTNPHWRVPAACDDFAFHYAEKVRGVDRFQFTRIDNGISGVPLPQGLEGLMKTAQAGTIVHMSFSGRAGENAGPAEGSHWAVYLGGGLIQDQWDTFTIAEFNKKYGNRKLEALFVHPNM